MMILHGKNGPVELNDVTIAALKKAWPTKDVDTEVAKAHLWLLAHPSRRPVYWFNFVRNWMRKAPDMVRPQPVNAQWWRDEKQTLEIGKSCGIAPRPGEEWVNFRQRVSAALAASRH